MFHKLIDERVSCTSILIEMQVGEYLKLVEAVYKKRGGLDGQRGPLKTKTASVIRERMVDDIRGGAVLPPVVLGFLASPDELSKILSINDSSMLLEILRSADDRVSIIDGMQRTTAMREAGTPDGKKIRVEIWISQFINSLIYRMLVLNTGQVPWEIGRQLETIYSQFLKVIKDRLGDEVEIFERDENRRRYSPTQYQGRNVIELMLLFSSRKSEIDIKDKIAEDFARLDAIESTAHKEFLDYFIETLRMMAQLDGAFSACYPIGDVSISLTRIRSGQDIFSSFPAMAGFCSAVSVELFDEPGFSFDWDLVPERMAVLQKNVETLVRRIGAMTEEERSAFMQFDLLEERLSVRSGQVGRFEREFFRKAFHVVLSKAVRLENMGPCWKAK